MLAATFNVKNLANQASKAPGLHLAFFNLHLDMLINSKGQLEEQRPVLVQKMRALTLSGDSAALFFVTMFPAAENTRLDGVEVAGTERYVLASLAT